ncbi:MAG: hypothetical protein SGPRY_011066 [Prymnesium sp.]
MPPLLLGATVAVLYSSLLLGFSSHFHLAFGTEVSGFFADGAPRWRCALGVPTQLCALPLLFLGSAWEHAFQLERWSARFAEGHRSASDWAFVFVFVAFLVLDWAIVDVRFLMAVHHAACLAGHLGGTLVWPAAFAYYFAGVCALELGSASCNIFCLYPSSVVVAYLYLLTMSTTHILTLQAFAACAADLF